MLRILGASVGPKTQIDPSIQIQNALGGDCSKLLIGQHVYIGPGCLFDLACSIRIDDDVALSAGVSFITHGDVGNRPLKNRFPRREGAILIRKGSWVCANTTILHGVTIGEYSVIGAMSLVNRDITDNTMAYGIPCRPAKEFKDQTK